MSIFEDKLFPPYVWLGDTYIMGILMLKYEVSFWYCYLAVNEMN